MRPSKANRETLADPGTCTTHGGTCRSCDYAASPRSPPLQEGLDEGVEVAVEHRLDVPGLLPRTFVLHQLVGVQGVGPDLAPERDLALLPRQALQLGLLLLAVQLRE